VKRSFRYYLNRFFKQRVDYSWQPERAWSMPSDYWLETGKVCNLRCQMCARELETRFHAGEDLQDRVFDLAEPYFQVANTVILYGWNEPLLDKRLFEKIERARRAGANVHFNTNATLLTEEAGEKLIDLGVTDIGVSLDGATKETYERIRIGANFERVLENIQRMVELKQRRKSFLPYLHLVFCVLKPNLDELPRMPALARRLGLPRIDVTDTVFYKPEMIAEFGYSPEALDRRLSEARAEGEKEGVQISYWPYDSQAFLKRISGETCGEKFDRRLCHELYKTMLVLANGDVVPCCFQWGEKAGNLKEQSVREVWNGPYMRDLRRRIRQGDPPPVCHDCPYLKKPGDPPGIA